MLAPLVAAVLVSLGSSPTPVEPPSRIVFASARTGVAQLYSVEPSGRGLAQLTFGAGGWYSPLPSPDGRFVAAFRGNHELWLMRGDGRDARLVAEKVSGHPSWSRNSRRLVFVQGWAIWAVAAAGGAPRQITYGHHDSAPTLSPDGSIAFLRRESGSMGLVVRRRGRVSVLLKPVDWQPAPSSNDLPAWSPDGEWIAITTGAAPATIELVRPSGGAPGKVADDCAAYCGSPELAWSPDSRRLAYSHGRGIRVVERSGYRWRLPASRYPLGFAWSPNGEAIAFATDSGVEVVRLSGRRRTLVRFRPHEAQGGVGWSWASADLDYRKPEKPAEKAFIVRVLPRELEARVPIQQFSADGDRIAYFLCPHIFGAWRPGDERPLFPRSMTPLDCHPPGGVFGDYASELTLVGDRLAYITGQPGNSVHLRVMLTTLERGDEGVTIVENANGLEERSGLDDVVGAGRTMFYGSRQGLDLYLQGPETIWRVAGTKPVEITHAPQDRQPLFVDRGRIVARRPDLSMELLNMDGGLLRTIHVRALGAVLTGDDLVVLVRHQLRDYSASTGDLRHVWPLPDVPGAKLDDAARGVVVYTLDGKVHLFRLRDGAEATVPGARNAELTDAGLFYSFAGKKPWPGRIRFVPFAELPLP